MKTLTVDIPIAKDQMNYRKSFQIMPGTHVKLKNFESAYKGKDEQKAGLLKIEGLEYAMDKLQFCLYAEGKRSLLICLQGLDAGGKDGVVRRVVGAINPRGCSVQRFNSLRRSSWPMTFCGALNRRFLGAGKS